MGFYGDITTSVLSGGAAYIKALDKGFADYRAEWGDKATLEKFRNNMMYFAGYCNSKDRATVCRRVNAWSTARGWKQDEDTEPSPNIDIDGNEF